MQSIELPTQGVSDNNPILADGTDPTEGLLSDSADGHFLVLPGYDQFITASPVNLSQQSGTTIPREVATINSAGSINTLTVLTNYASASTNNITGITTPGIPTSVASINGSSFWVGEHQRRGVRALGIAANPPACGQPLDDERDQRQRGGDLQ